MRDSNYRSVPTTRSPDGSSTRLHDEGEDPDVKRRSHSTTVSKGREINPRLESNCYYYESNVLGEGGYDTGTS